MKCIGDIRRERLAQLRDELGGISFADMNDKLGRNRRDATLSQVAAAAPNSASGRPRQMGDDQARAIETAFGKPAGWMDRDPDFERLLQQINAPQGASNVASYVSWPFSSVRPEHWRTLTPEQKTAVEQLIVSLAPLKETAATGTDGQPPSSSLL